MFIFIGLSALSYLVGNAAIEYKQYARSVKVKGLSEREYKADIVIWPILFSAAENDLETLYNAIDANTKNHAFHIDKGINQDEITFASPSSNDKWANQYSNSARPAFRYAAIQTVTVYSKNIPAVRSIKGALSELGKQGIVFTSSSDQSQTDYIFTKLNEVKPEMIEQATRKAREVAEKCASDSQSKLGKIKRASQGQFSITARDKNNPHIKKVRVLPPSSITCQIKSEVP